MVLHWFSWAFKKQKIFVQFHSINLKFELLWTTDSMILNLKLGYICISFLLLVFKSPKSDFNMLVSVVFF